MAVILCAGPGPHLPEDGVLGESDIETVAMLCECCAAEEASVLTPVEPTADEKIAALTETVDQLLLAILEGP